MYFLTNRGLTLHKKDRERKDEQIDPDGAEHGVEEGRRRPSRPQLLFGGEQFGVSFFKL